MVACAENCNMKTAVLSLLVGAAAAFAPADNKASTTALKAASPYQNELGAIPPVGFWDPLNLSKKASPERFERFRTAEVKHGRVAMMAIIGYVVPEFYRFPGEIAPGLAFDDIPNGVAAFEGGLPLLGWFQIIGFVGATEYSGFLGDFEIGKPELAPEELARRQTQEISHGRLAMLGIMELLRHDKYDDMAELIQGFPFLYN